MLGALWAGLLAVAACSPARTSEPVRASGAAASPVAVGSATGTARPAPTGGPSSGFALSGQVASTATYRLAELRALPLSSVSTNAKAGNSELGLHTYAGPTLYELVQRAQPKADAARKNDLLRRSIVVTGSRGARLTLASRTSGSWWRINGTARRCPRRTGSLG
jgi:hypothetical protein